MLIENGIVKEIYSSDLKLAYNSDGTIERILIIPEGVKEIHHHACQNLEVTSVILPKSLELIGTGAFKNCSELVNINIPKKVEFIGSEAFYNCKKLESVTLTGLVDTIYESTFQNCESLKNIQFPKGLERIKGTAFKNCKSLETIDLPDGILSIGESSFDSCTHLTSINLPESLYYIGETAFNNCRSLESLVLPDNIEEIPCSMCNDCISLKQLKLPKNAQIIEQRAFYGCKSLTNVEIPDGVENIKHFAFYDCKNLESVKLPNNPDLTIGGSVFSYCDKLKSINLPEGLYSINVSLFQNCKELSTIEIPSTVTSIIDDAFKHTGIKYIKLPAGLKNIDSSAFSHCMELEEIEIPDGVTSINKSAFTNCSNLRKVKFPAGLKKIHESAFSYCSNLISIKIPEGTKSLGLSAFANCRKLKYIELPESLETISDSCFYCNDSIETIKLPSRLQEISEQSFANCYNLKSIEIPDSVKKIKSYAFYCCGNLDNIKLPQNLETIDDFAFQHCTRLTSIEIPDSVTSLGDSVFTGCKQLREVKLPKNLTEIKSNAFANCTHLKEIEIPDSVKSIGLNAFYNCSALEKVTLPEGLEEIQSYAFEYCPNIKSIKIPSTIKKIDYDAFTGCSSLESITIPDSIEYFENSINKNLLYFKKEDNGFTLSSKPTKDSIPLKDLKINPSFLSKNWEYKDVILREQKNDNISNFYNQFLKNLPKQDIDKFMQSHNFTFFKQFNLHPENPVAENVALYKFLYNMGGFEKPFIDKNGKTVDYAQKFCGFMLLKFQQNQIYITDIFYATKLMETKGFKREFTDFFMKNFDEIMYEDLASSGFLARCYNEFERVQKTNTNNHGSQRQLKPTVQKFREYFEENKFLGITDENKHISDTISPYFSDQSTFDYAVKINDERIANKTPNNILGFHLREVDPFSLIDNIGVKIQDLQVDTLENLVDTATAQFNYEWLEKNDPKNYILGKLCSCCAHLEGVGEGIMHASITHPNVQNLVVKYGDEIIAKSTLYINPDEGYGVFNNVEVHDNIPYEAHPAIYEKYILGVRRFVEEYNKKHPDKPLKKISVGMNLNDLTEEIEKNHLPTSPLLTAIDYGKFTQCGEGYSGDSEEEQYTLWEKE